MEPENKYKFPEKWDMLEHVPRTPLPEVEYLEYEEGWLQWDLAVKLQDRHYGV